MDSFCYLQEQTMAVAIFMFSKIIGSWVFMTASMGPFVDWRTISEKTCGKPWMNL